MLGFLMNLLWFAPSSLGDLRVCARCDTRDRSSVACATFADGTGMRPCTCCRSLVISALLLPESCTALRFQGLRQYARRTSRTNRSFTLSRGSLSQDRLLCAPGGGGEAGLFAGQRVL